MKLSALQLFFRMTVWLCSATQAVNRAAGRLHQCAWRRCTAANLSSCNDRQAARTRFN